MIANATLQVERREVGSRYELNKIRKSGKVPGVIYGKGLSSPMPIALDGKELTSFIRSHPHAVIEVDVPGEGKHPIMMAEVQRDPMTQLVKHIDFRRVDMNAKISTSARLEVTGTSIGEREGGMLQLVLHEVDIECYPKDIPDVIAADVSQLGLGEHLTVADLRIPSGVAVKQDPETVVAAILAPQKERTEEELDQLNDADVENRRHREAALAVEKD
ncbi:50S ribosomal protein L25 [Cohnella panacarvi]|uniref:50S ribosomal protein L25 n=1 Tax=Cohnella panacarvi TaxID=400776 RepID=UPI00047BA1BB|nr:50S ribosomal protein L25 [Cohnella panacarvi]